MIHFTHAVSARALALFTIITLILSAFPAPFFVAFAASTGVTLDKSTETTAVGVQVNFVASAIISQGPTQGTYIAVSDNGNGGEIFSGTTNGNCNDVVPDADSQFAINQNKGVCYSNATPGIYDVSVQLLTGQDGEPIGDPAVIEITVEEGLETPEYFCKALGNGGYNMQTITPVNAQALNNGEDAGLIGDNGINANNIIPPFGDFLGFNWNEETQLVWENDCVAPEPTDPQPTERISAILECVEATDTGYRAHFSYENYNLTDVEILVGDNNKITGGGLAGNDQGQTTLFEYPAPNYPSEDRKGRTGFYPDNAFSVDFDGTNLVWSLKGPDGQNRTATANADSKACPIPEPEPAPQPCSIAGTVVAYTANEDAKKNNGTPVAPSRRNLVALETVAPYINDDGKEGNSWSESDFFSLGINGFLIYEFSDKVAIDKPGPDIAIYEVTGGPEAQQSDEKVKVSVSQDGVTYVPAGTFFGDAFIDINGLGLDYVKFVKLEDDSLGVQGNNGDGYDVDAIVILDDSCADEPKSFEIVATKIVCEDEADLPNGGLAKPINANTAADFLAGNQDSCELVPDWQFEWAPGTISSQNVNQMAEFLGGAWTTSGETDGTGSVTITITEDELNGADDISFREAFKDGYIPFTRHGENDGSNVSAEIYCHNDGKFFDNSEWLQDVEFGETYYCVAWNVPEIEQCQLEAVSNTGTVVVENNDYAVETYDSNIRWTASIPGATWIWETFKVLDPTVDTTRTFKETFTINNPSSAILEVAADNSYRIFINGDLFHTEAGENNYQAATQDSYNVLAELINGENTLEIEVTNKGIGGSSDTSNPAGLLYKLIVDAETRCELTTEPEPELLYACTDGMLHLDDESEDGTAGLFYNVNTASGATTLKATYDTDFHSVLAVDEDANVYSIEMGTGNLVRLDAGGVVTTIGGTGLNALKPVAMEFAPNGELYVLTQNEDRLYTLSTVDGSATLLKDFTSGEMNVNGGDVVAADFNEEETLLYVRTDGTVYAIDLGTLVATVVGDLKVDKVTSAAYDAGTYYAFTRDNEMVPFTYAPFVLGTKKVGVGPFYFGDGASCPIPLEEREDPKDPNPEPETYRIGGYKFERDLNEWVELAGWEQIQINGINGTLYIDATTTDATGYYYFDVPAGSYEITEQVLVGWNQIKVEQDGVEVEKVGNNNAYCTFTVGEAESYECDFFNEQEIDGPVVITPGDVTNGGGDTESLEIQRSSSRSGGTRIPRDLRIPQVAGAATVAGQCGMYLLDHMRMGIPNDVWEVQKLQFFLVGQGFFTPVTGIFDETTDKNVRAFQLAHKAEVLDPWFEAGIVPHDKPTGWVYRTTRWKINNIVCPGSEAFPSLTE